MTDISQEERDEYFRCEAEAYRLMDTLADRISEDVIDYSREILGTIGELGMVMEGLLNVLVTKSVSITAEEMESFVSIFDGIGYLDDEVGYDFLKESLRKLVVP